MCAHKRVDFKALRQRVPIEQVCDLLGMQLKTAGAQLRGACPICAHASQRCFVVTPALNRFWCFGHCHSGGDSIELVARLRQLSHKAAARLLADHFGEPP
jgi:DNA primase